MKTMESLRIAANAIRTNKVRVSLTISGIVSGVFLIFVLLSVGSGTARESTRLIAELAPNSVVIVHGYFPVEMGMENVSFSPSEMLQHMGDMEEGLPLFGSKLQPEMAYSLQRKLPDGCLITPLSIDIKSVEFGSRSRTVMLFATNENYARVRRQGLESGSYFSHSDKGRNVCVLGTFLKEKIFGEVEAVGREVRVGGKRLKVVGVLEERGTTFVVNNDDFLFVPYWIGGHLGASKTDGFLVSTPTPQVMRSVRDTCDKELQKLVGEKSFTVVTQEGMLALAADATRIFQVMTSIVTLVALLVGGVGIMNIMLVAVTERIREIGVRKALGAKPGDIVMQFLAESVLLGLAGGVVGISVGFLFIKSVEALFGYPAFVSAWSVALALLFSLAIGTIFGVWPALKAARLRPVESLQHRV